MILKDLIYEDYLDDIRSAIVEIADFTKGMSFEQFSNDKKTINAVLRSLEVIGEAAKKIPNSIRREHPDVPWQKMTGMRDKLIHDYSGVDYEIVWETIKVDLIQLEKNLHTG